MNSKNCEYYLYFFLSFVVRKYRIVQERESRNKSHIFYDFFNSLTLNIGCRKIIPYC